MLGPMFSQASSQRFFQLIQGEFVIQCRQHTVCERVAQLKFDQFAEKQIFVVNRIWNELGRRDEFCRIIDRQLVVRINDPQAKRD